jgi:excinuclease ABC subunit B
VAEEQAHYAALPPEALAKKIKQLERDMLQHAKNMQFEEAAKIRDQLKLLKEKIIGID